MYPLDWMNLYQQSLFKGKGFGGELDAALNKALTDKNLNLYSGGTTLSDDAVQYYTKLQNKGLVKDVSTKGAQKEHRVFQYKPHVNKPEINYSHNTGSPNIEELMQKTFDTYFSPAIKGVERAKWQLNHPMYDIITKQNVDLSRRLKRQSSLLDWRNGFPVPTSEI